MNTRIITFVMTLVLASLSCNGGTQQPDPTSTTTPTSTVTVTPYPSATSAPRIPSIEGELWTYQSSDRMLDLTGVFPYTHIPKATNTIEVTFYLNIPVGWPGQQTELQVVWYRNGSPLKDWEGSVVCSTANSCLQIHSSHFSSNGYEDGRYEARLYLGDQLIQGPEAQVWLIAEEWVGDLHLMQCDSGTADSCENAAGQLAKFAEQVTIPVGSSTIHVSNSFANLPPNEEWRLELHRQNQLIDSKTEIVSKDPGLWGGWRTTQLSNSSGAAFEPGTYTVNLIWKGQIIETALFEVKPKNGPTG